MQPLDGIKILDFSTLLPGPLASLMLAEAGATVLKVERPGGEDLRSYPPQWGGGSALFAAMNRGKKSIEIDLRDASSRSRIMPLIKQSDIILEQFRPGVMARLGLDYESIKAIKPDIIYCSITGYGQTGPRAQEAGHDVNFTALSGVLSFSTGSKEAPSLPPFLVGDIGGGTYPAVVNMLLALRQRDLTGEGCHLDISMADGVFAFAGFQMAAGQAEGSFPGNGDWLLTGASPRYQLYSASDETLFACAALETKFWKRFCDIIELPEHLQRDWENPEATLQIVRERMAAKPSDHWLPLFAEADCCVTPVKSFEEALKDPHFVERGLFRYEVENEDEKRMSAAVMPIADTFRNSSSIVKRAPVLGAHDDF